MQPQPRPSVLRGHFVLALAVLGFAGATAPGQSVYPGEVPSRCCPPPPFPAPLPAPVTGRPAESGQPPRAEDQAPAAQAPAAGAEPTLPPEQAAAAEAETTALAAPNMFGDLLMATRSVSFVYTGAGGVYYFGNGTTTVVNPKVADNNSPLPRDRVTFRYNHFEDAVRVTGISSDPPIPSQLSDGSMFLRGNTTTKSYTAEVFTLGGEKTFFDGRASVELRVPISYTLSSQLDLKAGDVGGFVPGINSAGLPNLFVQPTPGGTLGRTDVQLGDLTFIFKGLVARTSTWALSGGSGLRVPTAPDTRVRVTDFIGAPSNFIGQVIDFPDANIPRVREFEIKNQTWSMSPFVAVLATPNERLFTQGFLQADVPLSRNTVLFSEPTNFGPNFLNNAVPTPTPEHRLPPFSARARAREQVLLQCDVGTGYWLYRNPGARWVTGVAPTVEIHYTTTLGNADVVTLPGDLTATVENGSRAFTPAPQVGNLANRLDILNLTLGSTFRLGDRSTLATGFALPLRGGDDRTFDWEFQLLFNYYFGGLGGFPFVPNF